MTKKPRASITKQAEPAGLSQSLADSRSEAIQALDGVMDRLLADSGGEQGRDFTDPEQSLFDALIEARLTVAGSVACRKRKA